jgi:hypothetical protein
MHEDLPIKERTLLYHRVESASSYGSSFFIADRVDRYTTKYQKSLNQIEKFDKIRLDIYICKLVSNEIISK